MHPQTVRNFHCRGDAAARTTAAASGRLVSAKAMPFQLPSGVQLPGSRLNPLQVMPLPQRVKPSLPRPTPQDTSSSQPQLHADEPPPSTRSIPLPTVQLSPGAPHSSATASLKFAKHLANVSNGCAPPSSRFESLGWLLFETKRLQASCIGAHSQVPANWLDSPEGAHLLEQVYLVGMAIAELGTADGLQPLSTSNGSRAIVSLDYSRLLERYLQQHGQLLTEEFWTGLHAHDDLQARAIHVATALETRCMVHAMLFDKLIERVGTEGSSLTAWGSSSGLGQHSSGPLAAAITNNLINTTQQHSAPVSSQNVVSAPAAVNNNSNTATATPAQPPGGLTMRSVLAWVGQLGAIFLLVCSVAGKVVQVAIAVISFGKDLLLQLLMLKAVAAGAKAVAAKATAAPALRPAVEAAGAADAAALPAAAAIHALQAPSTSTSSNDKLQQQQQQVPWPAEGHLFPPGASAAPAAAAVSAGSLGLLAAEPLTSRMGSADKHYQQQQQPSKMQSLQPVQQQQQQQQWRLEAPVLQPTAAWPPAAAAQAQESLLQQQTGAVAGRQQQSRLPHQLLSNGLSTAQQLLHRAAVKVKRTAAAGLPGTMQQQQQQGLKQPFRAGSGHLLYSLWSPAEAGLQELEAEAAAAGVQYAEAGWGLGSSSAGVMLGSTDHGW